MELKNDVRKKSRERFVFLTKTAQEVCQFLDDRGVTHREGCMVRHLAEQLWRHSEEKNPDGPTMPDNNAMAPKEQPMVETTGQYSFAMQMPR